jgi:ribosome-associated heat shock protein Hsp15
MNDTRLDLWLKYVCVFKHRSEATEAVKGGRVKVNGNRVKPAASVRVDDLVEITEPRYRKLVVLEVPAKQASKDIARTMYRDETPVVEAPPEPVVTRDRGTGRPSKRERREMEKLKRW